MPNLNRKGPEGAGAMTGRKLGKCSPDNKGKTDEEILKERASSTTPVQGIGRGLGFGFGFGRGRGRGRGLGRFGRNS